MRPTGRDQPRARRFARRGCTGSSRTHAWTPSVGDPTGPPCPHERQRSRGVSYLQRCPDHLLDETVRAATNRATWRWPGRPSSCLPRRRPEPAGQAGRPSGKRTPRPSAIFGRVQAGAIESLPGTLKGVSVAGSVTLGGVQMAGVANTFAASWTGPPCQPHSAAGSGGSIARPSSARLGNVRRLAAAASGPSTAHRASRSRPVSVSGGVTVGHGGLVGVGVHAVIHTEPGGPHP